jgi:predicted nucleic acid-binding protein
MVTTTPWTRRPSVQALRRPVRDLLGGENSPAAFSLFPSHCHSGAAASSQRRGMLTNDALRVAVMQANAWTSIASHATDFDRVPGITRYAPV